MRVILIKMIQMFSQLIDQEVISPSLGQMLPGLLYQWSAHKMEGNPRNGKGVIPSRGVISFFFVEVTICHFTKVNFSIKLNLFPQLPTSLMCAIICEQTINTQYMVTSDLTTLT